MTSTLHFDESMAVTPTASAPVALGDSRTDDQADAFSALAREFYDRVFQFLARQLSDRHEAEDLTQRTFVRAYRAFDRFDQDRPFGPWIFTLARRELIDFFRKRKLTAVELDEAHAVSEDAPGDELDRRDEADQVWALSESPSGETKAGPAPALCRTFFTLPEVAEIMGITHVHAKVTCCSEPANACADPLGRPTNRRRLMPSPFLKR
jgi:RNA polymerase sigma factor (sigma-70 family)